MAHVIENCRFSFFIFQTCLDNSVSCLHFSLRSDFKWFLHRDLVVGSYSYVCLSSVIVRWCDFSFINYPPCQAFPVSWAKSVWLPLTLRTATRNMPRNAIWFNPRYSKNVKTNIARDFLLRLLDKHFTPNHKLKVLLWWDFSFINYAPCQAFPVNWAVLTIKSF